MPAPQTRDQASRRPGRAPLPTPPELLVFETDLGWMALATTERRVARLVFGYRSSSAARRAINGGQSLCRTAGPNDESDPAPPIDPAAVADRLTRFAAGEAVTFSGIEIVDDHLTPFSRQVVAACRELRWGETSSYGRLAEACGRPGAARAVGSVMAKNHVPLIVPCHRVLGAGGKLGGYSAPEGLVMKRRLLALEQP